MPAIIDYSKCDSAKTCFPMRRCPNGAISYDEESGRLEIDSRRCGDCPGTCSNFCDRYAIRYSPDAGELELVKAGLEGTMTEDEIAAARIELKKGKESQNGSVIELTMFNFEQEVVKSEIPVVVDFWAEWCAPCRQLAPFYQEMAKQYSGSLKFAKINVDSDPAIAQQFGVQSIPTLLFFYKGEVVDGVVGALPPPQLQAKFYGVLTAIRALEEPETEESSPEELATR